MLLRGDAVTADLERAKTLVECLGVDVRIDRQGSDVTFSNQLLVGVAQLNVGVPVKAVNIEFVVLVSLELVEEGLERCVTETKLNKVVIGRYVGSHMANCWMLRGWVQSWGE